MATIARAWGNFVNLGNLYSIPPWGRPLLGGGWESVRLPGAWAYFEDGSIYIATSGPFGSAWDRSLAMERKMRQLRPYVPRWAAKWGRDKPEPPEPSQLLIIFQGTEGTTSFEIHTRKACNGQRVVMNGRPYKRIIVPSNGTPSYDPSVTVLKRTSSLLASMRNFQGTLVNRVLQPDVRLGNGLMLDPTEQNEQHEDASPLSATNRDADWYKTPGKERMTEGTISEAVPPPVNDWASALSALERDLHYREEILSLRQRILELREQLVRAVQKQDEKSQEIRLQQAEIDKLQRKLGQHTDHQREIRRMDRKILDQQAEIDELHKKLAQHPEQRQGMRRMREKITDLEHQLEAALYLKETAPKNVPQNEASPKEEDGILDFLTTTSAPSSRNKIRLPQRSRKR